MNYLGENITGMSTGGGGVVVCNYFQDVSTELQKYKAHNAFAAKNWKLKV
jgi:hypothetical protein